MILFKDYYEILEVSSDVNNTELRKAYLKQVKKWHPDKNINFDTTEKMQDIVEANLILSDSESRVKYDREYLAFNSPKTFTQHKESVRAKSTHKTANEDYSFEDQLLETWVRNARKQSIKITQELIEELRLHFTNGLKGALDGMFNFATGKKWF